MTGLLTLYNVPCMTDTNPYRAMREATGLSLREVSRRTGINPGRLSIIERGVPPSDDERAKINAELGKVLLSKDGAS